MVARIAGLPRLRRKLRRMPDKAREEIGKAMEAIAADVVAMAKSLVAFQSGDLRDSIGWTWGDAPEGAMVLGKVKSRAKQNGNLSITIYAGNSEAFYARWVEFGTSSHVQGGLYAGSEHPGTAAQPYFFPAWRAQRKSAKSRVSRAITKAAKAVAAGR